jgi:CheY-like chemotaxis protein
MIADVTERCTILVIDDDADILESLTDALYDEGYQVASARDGFEGLEYLRGKPRPNLILLDWMMPRCDGICFRTLQKADPELRDIPVVVLTADTRIGERSQEFEARAYLRKPVDLDELLRTVEAHRSTPAA